jgi:hypothetical protein
MTQVWEPSRLPKECATFGNERVEFLRKEEGRGKKRGDNSSAEYSHRVEMPQELFIAAG